MKKLLFSVLVVAGCIGVMRVGAGDAQIPVESGVQGDPVTTLAPGEQPAVGLSGDAKQQKALKDLMTRLQKEEEENRKKEEARKEKLYQKNKQDFIDIVKAGVDRVTAEGVVQEWAKNLSNFLFAEVETELKKRSDKGASQIALLGQLKNVIGRSIAVGPVSMLGMQDDDFMDMFDQMQMFADDADVSGQLMEYFAQKMGMDASQLDQMKKWMNRNWIR